MFVRLVVIIYVIFFNCCVIHPHLLTAPSLSFVNCAASLSTEAARLTGMEGFCNTNRRALVQTNCRRRTLEHTRPLETG